jgi:hypothetical protein
MGQLWQSVHPSFYKGFYLGFYGHVVLAQRSAFGIHVGWMCVCDLEDHVPIYWAADVCHNGATRQTCASTCLDRRLLGENTHCLGLCEHSNWLSVVAVVAWGAGVGGLLGIIRIANCFGHPFGMAHCHLFELKGGRGIAGLVFHLTTVEAWWWVTRTWTACGDVTGWDAPHWPVGLQASRQY